ncbi:hypothetical protein DW1_0245 [Proteiniborus sp. DW1]|uniref:hypothetical protein n=1 Tax=Proteiniborus sp. DW1 TaxID=1889883 RepID=UPI00092DF6F3|nr:hypothetical protein [Proteiniborus sp. DW1]SCG81866.1 hypothetical protein DW1_0245 [Proteiniborus sp. DW1]
MSDLIEATFYTEADKVIYEFEATIKYIGNRNIYILNLNPILSSSYFSLLWDLNGKLTFKNSISTGVTISKIGGDSLSFYVDINHFRNKNILDNANTITINFADSTEIIVPGKIVKTLKIGHKLYCDFKYLNILESNRDQIFKQLFKKQTEFRKSIFSAMLT